MESEGRLHPASVIFALASEARQLLVPAAAALLFSVRSTERGWQIIAAIFFIPYSLAALVRCLAFRYRLEDDELVIRTGVVFRSVRHIPYRRIHNVDAVQNVVHRLLRVADVRIETGGGGEPEASMRVLSIAAYDELRRQIMARRAALAPSTDAAAAPEAQSDGELVLQLPPREVMLSGFIQNRAAIVVAAFFGLLWEFGLADAVMERAFGEAVPGRGVARQFFASLAGRADLPLMAVLGGIVGLVLILLLLRVISMFWALVTLYGYRLVQHGDELRAQFGLLTKVAATMPLERIQAVTVRHGLIHRRFGRVSVRVQTAGDTASPNGQERSRHRESLVPILPAARLQSIVDRILPGIDLGAVDWQPPHPRAFRRQLVKRFVVLTLLSTWLILLLGWWWLVLPPVVAMWAAVSARQSVRHQRWGITGDALLFRSGWLLRQMTIVRFARVQAAGLVESPFDRRHGMARVHVDTFGASGAPHPLRIPYLPRDVAVQLHHRVVGEATATRPAW